MINATLVRGFLVLLFIHIPNYLDNTKIRTNNVLTGNVLHVHKPRVKFCQNTSLEYSNYPYVQCGHAFMDIPTLYELSIKLCN
jgi:hypothetical protein